MTRSLFAFVALTQVAFADPVSNPILHVTMETISKDVKTVSTPVLSPNPATVKDEAILTSIVRVRTAASQLQLVSDRAEGEMFPPMLAGLPEAELKTKLLTFRELLAQAKSETEAMETLLKVELAKPTTDRTFKPLSAQLGVLQGTIQKAHTLFKPPQPQ